MNGLSEISRSTAIRLPKPLLAISKTVSVISSMVSRFSKAEVKNGWLPRSVSARRSSGWKMTTKAIARKTDRLRRIQPITARFEELGEEGETKEDERKADENARAMGAAQVDVNVIENRRENADLDRNAPILRDEFSDGLEH